MSDVLKSPTAGSLFAYFPDDLMRAPGMRSRVVFDKADEGGGAATDTNDDATPGGDQEGSEKTTDTPDGKGDQTTDDAGKKSDAKDGKGDGQETDEGDGKGDGAPDKYDDFTLPEGVTVEDKDLSFLHEFGKAKGLSQEAMQELVDHAAARELAAVENAAQVWSDTKDEWSKASKKDKEVGGDDFDAKSGRIKEVLSEVMGKELPDFEAALEITGLDHHPEMRRLLLRVSKLVLADKSDPGGRGRDGGGKRSRTEILYPNS